MKLTIFIILLNLGTSCGNSSPEVSKTIQNDKELAAIVDDAAKKNNAIQVHNDSISKASTGIQKKTVLIQEEAIYEKSIDEVVSKAFTEKNATAIDAKLKAIEADSKMSQNYKMYWKTYLFYYKAIIYKNILGKDDKAEEWINKSLATIENQLKTSEEYALYAACLSYSIQFANMTQLGNISSKVQENANIALELNSKNVRAYYVLTSQNFYTPKMFGGMTKVEEYGIKGLACPNALNENIYSPHWGKALIYDMLIKFYETEKRTEDALKMKTLAQKEFPERF